MSVSGSGIAYTADYGKSWRKIDIPEKKQRFATIFFNTRQEGLIGSLWDYLAYTNDNCKSWQILPTPLQQQKYNKTNISSRPEFSRVAICKEYFLVLQDDLVFYSKRDSINWKLIPGYTDFFTDAENSALFFESDNGYVKVDDRLTPVYYTSYFEKVHDASCKNGSLFIITTNSVQQLNGDNKILSFAFAGKDSSLIEPVVFGCTAFVSYGSKDNKVFEKKGYNGKWKYRFTLPFLAERGMLSMYGPDMLLFKREDDSLFYYGTNGEEVERTSMQKMLANFCRAGLRSLIFEKGSSGCFHNYNEKIIYEKKNDGFSGAIKSASSGDKDFLPDNNTEINLSVVENFFDKIPSLFDTAQRTSINDLGFSEKEYGRCRKDILDFKERVEKKKQNKDDDFYFNKNNLDFNRLLNLVDSIKVIDQRRLQNILFSPNIGWSTTTNWTGFSLINGKNQVLSITSSYYKPNALYFPWVIEINGYKIASTNIAINTFLKSVYPNFLDDDHKTQILHTLVKALY